MEILKTINKTSPQLMNGIFTFKENEKLVRENHKAESQVPTWNQITFGEKTVKRVWCKVME